MSSNAGYLEVYHGCMFASKTQHLKTELNRYIGLDTKKEIKVLYINNNKDQRPLNKTGHNSHELADGVDTLMVDKLSDIDLDVIEKYDIIGVNEGQFFEDLVINVLIWVDKMHKRVICVGLDTTFERKPWKNMSELCLHADKVEKLTAYCKLCLDNENKPTHEYSKALFSHCLKPNDDSTIPLPGGAELYIPVCRKHYNQLNSKVVESLTHL